MMHDRNERRLKQKQALQEINRTILLAQGELEKKEHREMLDKCLEVNEQIDQELDEAQ